MLLPIGFFLPAFHARLKKNSQWLVCFILPFTEHAFFCPRQAALTEEQSFTARQTQAEKRISVKAALGCILLILQQHY